MKGQVIAFDEQTNKGKISGHDGMRYDFTLVDWADGAKRPKVGLEVDFDVNEDEGNKAKDIIILKGGTASDKSRTAYILLAIFIGPLGVHNFFAGYTGRGIAQLLITVITVGIGTLITYPWAIIEAITVKVDSEGRSFS